MKIDCTFLNADGSCQNISQAVGLPIIVSPSACQFCIKTNPKPETRHESYPVLNLAWTARKERGLPVGPPPKYVAPSSSSLADELLARAKQVPRPSRNIPIIADPQERLKVCAQCPKWKGTRQNPEPRCRQWCNCTDAERPDPLADEGTDCPRLEWRRPKPSESVQA